MWVGAGLGGAHPAPMIVSARTAVRWIQRALDVVLTADIVSLGHDCRPSAVVVGAFARAVALSATAAALTASRLTGEQT